jgi:hypothetical protein
MPDAVLARGQVNTILNAATGTGAGAAFQVFLSRPGYGNYSTSFAWQVNVAGTFSALSVNLEGSLDGVNWTTLSNITAVGGSMEVVANAPIGYLRANVVTFTGGTSVTVLLTLG